MAHEGISKLSPVEPALSLSNGDGLIIAQHAVLGSEERVTSPVRDG
jgi:hypothetical protein